MAAKKLPENELKVALTVHLERAQYDYVSQKSRPGAWVREAVREKMEREAAANKRKQPAKTGHS